MAEKEGCPLIDYLSPSLGDNRYIRIEGEPVRDILYCPLRGEDGRCKAVKAELLTDPNVGLWCCTRAKALRGEPVELRFMEELI